MIDYSKDVTIKKVLVTPSMAEKMLEKNTRNRNIIDRSLHHYIRQVVSGQWIMNGDTIRFCRDGSLMDGQHRLATIIESKKPMPCIVVEGLHPDAMCTIDTGRPRTVGDHLRISGKFKNITNYMGLSAAVTLIARFKNGKYIEQHQRLTPAEAINMIKNNQGILLSSERMMKRPELTKVLPFSVACTAHFFFSNVSKFKTEEFFNKLETGENLGKTSPILQLRSELLGMKSYSARRGRMNQRTFLYYTFAAFQAFLDERRIDGFAKFGVNSVIELPKKRGGG